MNDTDRRGLLIAAGAVGTGVLLAGRAGADEPGYAEGVFPTQDPERVAQIVGASHGNIDLVRALLDEEPDLAKASVDWGFGDWETAIGAASHVGNREIVALLFEHGARPTLFTHAMLGHTAVVRAALEAQPELAKIRGPHGISLLRHAGVGGEAAAETRRYIERVVEASPDSSQSVSEEDLAELPGVFDAPGYRVRIEANSAGLRVRINAGNMRGLVPMGGGAFRPAGSDGARLVFSDSRDRVRVTSGPVSFEAKRVS